MPFPLTRRTSSGGSGDVATDAIFDAKGDLPVGTGADTAVKLTAGANDTMLMAASGAATGLKWATTAEVITAITGVTGGLPIIGELASDFNFTVSNTTLQSITGMAFDIGASATEIWLVEVFMELTAANTTMDSKFGFATLPSGATLRLGGVANGANGPAYGVSAVGVTPGTLGVGTQAVPAGSASGTYGVLLVAKIYGGGTGGTVQLQGAQNTSDGGQLTAKAGSVLRATKIKA